MNIERRHANIQKGVQQNGIGNKNIQKDVFGWRHGKWNTVDVQQNVKQNGMNIKNDKSLRRINEMMRNFMTNMTIKKRPGYRRNGNEMEEKPSRRNQFRNDNRSDQLNEKCESLQEQVNMLKWTLCEAMSIFCEERDEVTRRTFDGKAENRKVASKINNVQGVVNPSFNHQCPFSTVGTFDKIIFLPNYEINLN